MSCVVMRVCVCGYVCVCVCGYACVCACVHVVLDYHWRVFHGLFSRKRNFGLLTIQIERIKLPNTLATFSFMFHAIFFPSSFHVRDRNIFALPKLLPESVLSNPCNTRHLIKETLCRHCPLTSWLMLVCYLIGDDE